MVQEIDQRFLGETRKREANEIDMNENKCRNDITTINIIKIIEANEKQILYKIFSNSLIQFSSYDCEFNVY